MFGDLLEGLRADVFMRKVLEYFLCSLRHVSGSCEHESQWTNGFWHHSQGYFVACVTNGLSCHFGVAVVVCRSNMLKRKLYVKEWNVLVFTFHALIRFL